MTDDEKLERLVRPELPRYAVTVRLRRFGWSWRVDPIGLGGWRGAGPGGWRWTRRAAVAAGNRKVRKLEAFDRRRQEWQEP